MRGFGLWRLSLSRVRCWEAGRRVRNPIQGIGAGFVPDNLDVALIDEVAAISNRRAFETARLAARLEGMPVGISSGAALAATFDIATRAGMEGQRVVTILASSAERYLTTPLFEGLDEPR